MKTELGQMYTLDNVSRTFEKTIDSLLFERLYTVNLAIENCNNDYELVCLHKHRDYVINMMLVHENKIEEIKDINGVCYTVIKS